MRQNSPDRPGPQLRHRLDQLHPHQDPPRRHPLARQDLVLVVPTTQVRLDHPSPRCHPIVRRPPVRGGVERLDLIRIVRHHLPQCPPVVPVRLLRESCHIRRHRQNAVLPQQTDGLTVCLEAAVFLDPLQRGFVRALQAHQEPGHPSPLVERQQIRVAHDVVSPGRADQDQRHLLGHQRFEKGPPGRSRGCGILVREVDYLDPVRAMKPGQFPGEPDRIAMPPSRPESALATVVAAMRTPSRELHHHGPTVPPVAVPGVVDQLPPHPVRIQVNDRPSAPGCPEIANHTRSVLGSAASSPPSRAPKHDPRNRIERGLAFDRMNQSRRCLFTLTAHDHVDLRLRSHDLAPVVGREHASIEDPDPRTGLPNGAGDLHGRRMP